MDLNGWNSDCCNRIPQRNAGMGIGGRVENNHVEFSLGLLNPIDQFTLQIGLAKVDRYFSSAARLRTLASISAKVARPYTSGSRWPEQI